MKDMQRSDWRRVVKRTYAARNVCISGRRGKAALIVMHDVTAPLTVHYDFGDALIADCGYRWLQVALEGLPWWLTAMYDDQGRFIQFYFDITAGNCFDDPDNPCFEDMYLDVVVTRKGELHVVDANELQEALDAGKITQAQYDAAQEHCRRLVMYLQELLPDVTALCSEQMAALL